MIGSIGSISGHIVSELVSESTRTCLWKASTEFLNTDILKGKVNKRLDNCIFNLLKYVRDKTFDRLIKEAKGKSTDRVNMIHDRHLRSLSLPVELTARKMIHGQFLKRTGEVHIKSAE